jgi:hypothetical protein
MTITRNKKDQLVITLDGRVDPDAVRRLLDKLEFMELAAGSNQVSAKRVNEIAEEVKASWWSKYKVAYRAQGRR